MHRPFFILGSVFALLGVALGAFAAHTLKSRLSTELLAAFETGVRYQMYHALALLVVAWVYPRWAATGLTVGGWLFVAGIFLFSGSLYGLSLTGVRWLGAITPFGGLAFLAGWACLVWTGWRAG